MVVQHNLTAMNSNRQLGVTSTMQQKASEKLSSGYKINRAADDAAGLSISEKMRSQIRGLDRASSNAQDGISLIQSAEGALNEAHSILQRMNELAVQGANDTNQEVDREAINQELDALTEELDRISTTTHFNKQNLLDGSFTNKNLQVGANTGQKIAVSIQNMNAASLGLKSISYSEVQKGTSPEKTVYGKTSVKYCLNKTMAQNISIVKKSVAKTISDARGSNQYVTQWNGKSAYFVTLQGSKYALASQAVKADVSYQQKEAFKALSGSFGDYIITSGKTAGTSRNIVVGQANVRDYNTANATLSAVQAALNKVSSQRSALGAIQNRLEHTVANLDTVSENTSAAESRIRDTDMAKQMVDYSKNNILAQAGQSMLAQANQLNQGALSLLG